jgi:N-hydroxyarylamine O-acetyltransferase
MYSKLSKQPLINDYFEKINCEFSFINNVTSEKALEYLEKIFTCHIQTYPFHNFELREASQSHPIFRKQLTLFNMEEFNKGNHGGFCIQKAQVLHKALRCVGFNVYSSMAKVLNGLAPDSEEAQKIPATHLILIVNIENKKYLLDPSLGVYGHSSPFLLSESTTVYQQNKHQFKIERINNEFLFYREIDGVWCTSFCSSFLAANQQYIMRQLTKLERHPETLGIRDTIILVGIATPTGGKTLLWNSKTNMFMYKIICSQGIDKEETFSDINRAYNLIFDEFKIEHISKLEFKQYCSEKCWPETKGSNTIDFPIDEYEMEKIKGNYL